MVLPGSKGAKKTVRVGILGGGQLGLMLIEAGRDLGVKFSVLDPDSEAPCRDVADLFVVGDFRDFSTVMHFGKNCDVVTIEIEDVNVEALRRLRDEQGVTVFPQPEVISVIQDKGIQKEFYRRHNIATADFVLLENRAELETCHDFLPGFLKLRRGGYDGRGVMRVTAENIARAFDAPCVLEKVVAIEKEISVILARDAVGQIKMFPLVEMTFHSARHVVDLLLAPARLSPEQVDRAYHLARQVAQDLGVIGVLAVEMFVTQEGEILVNEIAPRPHNSGHHTIEANETSQYLLHLQTILGREIGSTHKKSIAVMINLLGSPDHDGVAKISGVEEVAQFEGVFIHLYGKTVTHPWRKMGHVTILDDSLENAMKRAKEIKEKIRIVT